MKKKKILILGASGLIGEELFYFFKTKGFDVIGTYRNNPKKNLFKLDINQKEINEKIFKKISHIIICQNSFKKLDDYEINWETSKKTDLISLSLFLKKAKKNKIIPIFFSSDAVFDGLKGNYKESDKVKPVNKYGYLKVKMEDFIRKNFKKYMILRFSKIFSNDLKKKDFMSDMIFNIENNNSATFAEDEFFSPLYLKDLKKYIYKLIKKEFIGTMHLSSVNKISRYRLALKIKSFKKSKCKIIKTKINSLNLIAKRGKDCTLNTNKYDKQFSIKKKTINFYLNNYEKK